MVGDVVKVAVVMVRVGDGSSVTESVAVETVMGSGVTGGQGRCTLARRTGGDVLAARWLAVAVALRLEAVVPVTVLVWTVRSRVREVNGSGDGGCRAGLIGAVRAGTCG